MPNSVIFVLLVELALIVLTTLLLARPNKVFRSAAGRLGSVIKVSGMVCLCLTFCWSVVVGIVLSMNDMTLRI